MNNLQTELARVAKLHGFNCELSKHGIVLLVPYAHSSEMARFNCNNMTSLREALGY